VVPDGPFALACGVPVKLLAIPDPASARITAIGAPGGVAAAWITDNQTLASIQISFSAPDVGMVAGVNEVPDAYDVVSLAIGTQGFVFAGRTSNTTAVRVFDITLQPVAAMGVGSPFAINTSRAAVATGATNGAIYAVTGKNGTQAAVFGVGADNSLVGTPFNIGVADKLMSLVPLGSRIGVINDSNANNCELRSMAPDLSSVGAPASYGSGTCDQPSAAFVAGRGDVFFATHNMTANIIESQILTLSGTTVTLGTGLTVQNQATNPRASGSVNGYWVLYHQTNIGALEATHVSFTNAADNRTPLGSIAEPTAYDVAAAGADTYAVWFASGLHLVRLCP